MTAPLKVLVFTSPGAGRHRGDAETRVRLSYYRAACECDSVL
jgi:hypothetical protein